MWFSDFGVTDRRIKIYPEEWCPIYWRNDDGRKWVQHKTVPGYYDETFASAVQLWKKWKTFGLPHGGGWLGERAVALRAIEIVEEERNLYESRRMEEARNKRGNS